MGLTLLINFLFQILVVKTPTEHHLVSSGLKHGPKVIFFLPDSIHFLDLTGQKSNEVDLTVTNSEKEISQLNSTWLVSLVI